MNDKDDSLSAVEQLADHHICDAFDCGKHTSLTEWLKKFALSSQKANSSRTFIVHRNNQVIGYYSLCAASVSQEEATVRARKGLAKQAIPAILLARLAVNEKDQGQGIGPALLKDALMRCLDVAQTIGARVVLVHAIDEEAKQFYKHWGFEDSPIDDLQLMLLMKDLEKSLKTKS